MSINGNEISSDVPCVSFPLKLKYSCQTEHPNCDNCYWRGILSYDVLDWADNFPTYIVNKDLCHISHPSSNYYRKTYTCYYYNYFISLYEVNENLSTISPEYLTYIKRQEESSAVDDGNVWPNGYMLKDITLTRHDLETTGIQLVSGKIYRIKLAGLDNEQWREDVRYFKYLEDDLYINYNLSNNVSANNITFENTTITNDITATASNSIVFKSGTIIKSGTYKTEENNCSEILIAKYITSEQQDYDIYNIEQNAKHPCPCSTRNYNNKSDYLIEIYPNPTHKYITFVSKKNIISLTIETITGNKIINRQVGGNSVKIDLSNFDNGTYISKIKLINKIITKKIIKM